MTYNEVIEAGEHLPGMAALWDVATPEERREMVTIILEPEGLYYDTEQKMIAALKPHPAFLPVLRILKNTVEYKETSGSFVITHWSERNRRALNHRSHLALIPIDQLFNSCGNIFISAKTVCEQAIEKPALVSSSQYNSETAEPKRKIPVSEWPSIFRRIVENQEPLRKVAGDYSVSYETIRRIAQIMDPRRKKVSKQ